MNDDHNYSYDEKDTMYSTVVGIDLGTTNSCVGTWKVINGKGNVEILSSKEGNQLIPSCVSFMPDGTELIGESAMHQRLNNRENTVFDIKRLIGRSYTDSFVQKMRQQWPFKVVPDQNGGGCPMVEIIQQQHEGGKTGLMSPTEMQAKILRKMRETAKLRLGHPVVKAVITVPAYFGQGPRRETRKAAEMAGFEMVRLLNEPTAAAYFFGFDQQRFHGYNLLVFDLGGGTFDCTILEVQNRQFCTLAIDGIENLGGRDFDQLLMELMQEKIWTEHQRRIKGNPRLEQKLLLMCQTMKEHLSSNNNINFDLEEFFDDLDDDDTVIRVSQAEFNDKCQPLANRCMDKVRALLKSVNMRAKQIDEILMVGGSSRLPLLQEMLRTEFAGKTLNFSVNTDMAVANGATLYAAQMCTEVKDSLPSGMNIREATPLSIGSLAYGDKCVKIIPRNSKIPIKNSLNFCNSNRISAEYCSYMIYEGERLAGRENNHLGNLKLENCVPNQKGEIRTELTLELDADGILHASAMELLTKRRVQMRIDYSQGSVVTQRGSNAVETMLVDAAVNQQRDKQELWRIEAMLALQNEINLIKYNLHKKASSLPVDNNVAVVVDYVSDAEQRVRTYKLEQCKHFEEWLHKNKDTASRQELISKLDEFQLACSLLSAVIAPVSFAMDNNNIPNQGGQNPVVLKGVNKEEEKSATDNGQSSSFISGADDRNDDDCRDLLLLRKLMASYHQFSRPTNIAGGKIKEEEPADTDENDADGSAPMAKRCRNMYK